MKEALNLSSYYNNSYFWYTSFVRPGLVVFTKVFVYVNLHTRVDKPCTGNAEYRSIRMTSILHIALVSLPRIGSLRSWPSNFIIYHTLDWFYNRCQFAQITVISLLYVVDRNHCTLCNWTVLNKIRIMVTYHTAAFHPILWRLPSWLVFGRITLAIPVYRLAMSVCQSTFWFKFQVEAKSQHWKGLQTWNFAWR